MVWIKNRAEEQLEFSLFVQLLMRYENFCMVHMKLPLTDSRAGRYGLTASLAMFRDKKKKKKSKPQHFSYIIQTSVLQQQILTQRAQKPSSFQFFFFKENGRKKKRYSPSPYNDMAKTCVHSFAWS